METIRKYFPELSTQMIDQLSMLESLYEYWNSRINVISRKDLPNLYKHHVLPSLSIAKILSFRSGSHLLDVGTGGGFPGIPLAILFPETDFLLIDSIGKKIRVVKEIVKALHLSNIIARQERIERINNKFDYIVCRAVTSLPVFYLWVKNMVIPSNSKSHPNAILYIKGGEFKSELKTLPKKTEVIALNTIFNEPFFDTKNIVFIPY